MSHVVVDLNDQRPIWRQPAWFAEELRRALPEDWTLSVLETPSEGTGDGSTRVHPEVLDAVADARVYMGFGIASQVLEAAPKLEWVHSGSAGVTSSLTPEMLRRREVVFTNTAGVHGPPMAEAALGMILHFFRGFDLAVRNQADRRWNTAPFYAADAPLRELSESTVGILGLGGVGGEVAWRCRALGARVLGLRQNAGPGPKGVEVVHGADGLDLLLSQSDALVVTAPDTPRTRGLLDAAALDRMKPGAVLVNVARGSIVDEEALVECLRDGRLRGAGLDVFDSEPLPADSPLWTLPNVLITPHVSPVTRHFWRREADLVLHNLRCLVEGRVEAMRNVVDRDAGY
ncbi:MAG: D-2-hydroxyacid dehydrogenase [Gemmatimonadota bacterium]